jgi:hypothetical protein
MTDAPDTRALLYTLQGLSLARNIPIPVALTGLATFEPILEEIRRAGGLFLLNFIPQPNPKNKPSYRVSISGGEHWDGGATVVAEDAMMERAIARAVLEYARRCWDFVW